MVFINLAVYHVVYTCLGNNNQMGTDFQNNIPIE